MRRRLSILALATLGPLLAAGCGSTPVVPAGPPPELGPVVSISFVGGALKWGDLARVRVHITNGTLDPIVLRSVDLPGQLPDRRLWLTTRKGRVHYEASRKRAVWRPWVRDETHEVFASGFLLPAETITVERWLRVRTPVQDVVVLYQPARLNVFFPGSRELTPTRAEPRELYFREPSLARGGDYRRGKPGSEERVVLFYGADTAPIVRRQFPIDLVWSDLDMPGAAMDELDVGEGELSAWDGGPAWIVRRPASGDLVVAPNEGETEIFPGFDFLVFDFVDVASLEGSEVLVDVAPEEEYDRVDPGDFLEFLRGVRNQGARLNVVAVDTGADDREWVLQLR